MIQARGVSGFARQKSMWSLARQLRRPNYDNLVRLEPVLRRLVPVLLIIFVIVAAAAVTLRLPL